MKDLAFIKRSSGSHWVGDGFPVRLFTYKDADELTPFLLLDYAGPAISADGAAASASIRTGASRR